MRRMSRRALTPHRKSEPQCANVFLEDVFEGKLHLPHISGDRRDAAEGWAAEVIVWKSPHWMVQEVIGFPAKLQLVTFDGQAEILLQRGIQKKAGRAGDGIAPGITKLKIWLQNIGSDIEPFCRRRVAKSNRLAASVGTVITDVGVGAVYAGRWIDVEARTPCGNTAELPPTDDRVQERILNVQLSPFSRGQVIQRREHHPMTIVESRWAPVAKHAAAVLREKRVAVGGANSAGGIDCLGPSVGEKPGQPVGISFGEFGSERIVVRASTVFD